MSTITRTTYCCDYCGTKVDVPEGEKDSLPKGWLHLKFGDNGPSFEFDNPNFHSVGSTPKESCTKTIWALKTPIMAGKNKFHLHVCDPQHAMALIIAMAREMIVEYQTIHNVIKGKN